jgi:hypothetical protein
MTKPFDFLTPLMIEPNKFAGNLRISGNAWRGQSKPILPELQPDEFEFEITGVTYNDNNIFDLWQWDDYNNGRLSILVDKVVLQHCQGLFGGE